MKTNEANALPSTDERVLKALRAQQRGLRWLTGLAVAFWICAVLGSVGVMVGYRVFYQPKEKQMMSDYEKYGHIARHANSPANERSVAKLTPEQALSLHFTMNYAMTKGILAVAISVVVLSCGTLTTLLLVVFNRRVTLKQINHSLAQISEQLKHLQNVGG